MRFALQILTAIDKMSHLVILRLLSLVLQLALLSHISGATSASSDFELVSECCNAENTRVRIQDPVDPTEKPCLDAGRNSLLCLRYSCKQKSVLDTSPGGTRMLGTGSDLEPIMSFGRFDVKRLKRSKKSKIDFHVTLR